MDLDSSTTKRRTASAAGWHRSLDGRLEADSFVELGRSAAHQVGGRVARRRVCGNAARTATGSIPWASNSPRPDHRADLEDDQTHRRAGAGQASTNIKAAIALEEVVGQVHAADAVVDEPHLSE